MDADFRHSSHDSRSANDADADSSPVPRSRQTEAHCMICRRAFDSETQATGVFEAICLCGEGRSMVLDGNETSITVDLRMRRRQRGRSRQMSSESIEDLFSQRFSHLISLVRQNHEAQVSGDDVITVQRGGSYNASPGRVSRWQRTFSDSESDGIYQTDSLFDESESNISFDGYGEYDTSVDGLSLLGREMLIPLDDESHTYTDTDIDPMHAGLDQWNSDGGDDEDGDGGEAEMEPLQQTQDVNHSPMIRRRTGRNHRYAHYADIDANLDESEITPRFVDEVGLEELLDQLVDTGSSRRGASISVKLPHVVISKDHETNGGLVCAVCKDPLPVDTEAKQLPCLHLYHPTCILPWLKVRNTCPVCRYEIPTDGVEYEEKRSFGESREIRWRDPAAESSSDLSSDGEADEVSESNNGRAGDGGARRWVLLAAAPIVSIVGMALVLWFQNHVGNMRIQFNTGEQNLQQLQRPRGASGPGDRNRRWWSVNF